MRRTLFGLLLVVSMWRIALQSQPPAGHYLFAWTGDAALKGNDFMAIIDADPASKSYGKLVTTFPTTQKTVRIHHTEYIMPASGRLFENDHDAGRTFIFDVRDPLHLKVVASFTDMAGYMHPHSYIRLPNGHVLASFQHVHHGEPEGLKGGSGGLVEIDDNGIVVRAASSLDPAFPDTLLTPYSLAVLPNIDRVVSTNSSMDWTNMFAGVSYQIWRLSDLKLLKTAYLDTDKNLYAHISPEEPRVGPDGAVYVQTLGCGIERISDIDKSQPVSKLVHTFPGSGCGVPTIVGHFLIQSVPVMHGLVTLDIANGTAPKEVGCLKLADHYESHWTAWDAKTQRIVVTGDQARLFLVKMDAATGSLALDAAFHDDKGRPGFDFANRQWPHGWTGTGEPHGVVFSRN